MPRADPTRAYSTPVCGCSPASSTAKPTGQEQHLSKSTRGSRTRSSAASAKRRTPSSSSPREPGPAPRPEASTTATRMRQRTCEMRSSNCSDGATRHERRNPSRGDRAGASPDSARPWPPCPRSQRERPMDYGSRTPRNGMEGRVSNAHRTRETSLTTDPAALNGPDRDQSHTSASRPFFAVVTIARPGVRHDVSRGANATPNPEPGPRLARDRDTHRRLTAGAPRTGSGTGQQS